MTQFFFHLVAFTFSSWHAAFCSVFGPKKCFSPLRCEIGTGDGDPSMQGAVDARKWASEVKLTRGRLYTVLNLTLNFVHLNSRSARVPCSEQATLQGSSHSLFTYQRHQQLISALSAVILRNGTLEMVDFGCRLNCRPMTDKAEWMRSID